MRSPFPGMDPYLERRWGDVHTALCIGVRAALQPALPPGLRARAEEDVLLEDESGSTLQMFRPDAVVIRSNTPDARRERTDGATAVAEEFEVDFSLYSPIDRWVQIIDTTDGERVITAIEILSPSNKAAGRSNDRYRKKLDNFMNAGVNVVEVDLLRSDRRNLIVKDDAFLPEARPDYVTCIWRVMRPSKIAFVRMPLRQPLPTIPIPCRETDADVPLSVQPLIDRIYAEGGHDDIDYTKPLDPPLSPADAQWAAELFAQRK